MGNGEDSCSDGGHGYNSIKKYYYDRTREPVNRTRPSVCQKRRKNRNNKPLCLNVPSVYACTVFSLSAFSSLTPPLLRSETFRACKLFTPKTTTARFFFFYLPPPFADRRHNVAVHVVCVCYNYVLFA